MCGFIFPYPPPGSTCAEFLRRQTHPSPFSISLSCFPSCEKYISCSRPPPISEAEAFAGALSRPASFGKERRKGFSCLIVGLRSSNARLSCLTSLVFSSPHHPSSVTVASWTSLLCLDRFGLFSRLLTTHTCTCVQWIEGATGRCNHTSSSHWPWSDPLLKWLHY